MRRNAPRLLRPQIIYKALFSISSICFFNPTNPMTYLPFEQVFMGPEEKSLKIARLFSPTEQLTTLVRLARSDHQRNV